VSEFINNIMTARQKHQAAASSSAFAIIEERISSRTGRIRKAMSMPPVLVKAARSAAPRIRCLRKSVRRAAWPWRSSWLMVRVGPEEERSMAHKLASRIHCCLNGEGSAIKKKEDTHKMAEANKAFAHFKW
jgi:small subunit ribosomal protein S7